MRSKRFKLVLDKLAAAEVRFLRSEFLAPRVRGGEVRVRIDGVVCTLRVASADFEGWGIFRPLSHSSAELVREAGLAQRRQYLELFPLVRLVLCLREDRQWMAVPAHQGDQRFRIEGLAPVRLAEEVQRFDVVRARFDGANFWFDAPAAERDPAAAAYLRKSLSERVKPDDVARPGLTPEERAAYAISYFRQEAVRKRQAIEESEQALRGALRHAGAELVDFLERGDSYRVTFKIGDRQHVSAVRKGDLAVQVAGICLSGMDRQFDLTSLVGVIREAEGSERIVAVGRNNGGVEEQQYWDVHPPR